MLSVIIAANFRGEELRVSLQHIDAEHKLVGPWYTPPRSLHSVGVTSSLQSSAPIQQAPINPSTQQFLSPQVNPALYLPRSSLHKSSEAGLAESS